jgi:hypothetical protein
MTFIGPELSEQPRLLAVIGGANTATEQNEPAVILTSAEDLTRVPGERCPVKCNQHQASFCARDQQCGIVEPQP